MNAISDKKRPQVGSYRIKTTSTPRRVVSSQELQAKRDEAVVRREARAVLGTQSRWLDVPNGMYGGLRPIDMVRQGHTDLVMDVLARVKYGMFS